MFEIYNTFTKDVVFRIDDETLAGEICEHLNETYGRYYNNTWTYMYRRAK